MSWNENHIKTLEIQNFKSIKQLQIDCNRINLFVGKPNVGKSNILEALSLFAVQYMYAHNKKKLEPILNLLIRKRKIKNLFYDQNKSEKIVVRSDKFTNLIGYGSKNFHFLNCKNTFENIKFDDFYEDVFSRENEQIIQIKPEEAYGAINRFISTQKNVSVINDSYNTNVKPYFYNFKNVFRRLVEKKSEEFNVKIRSGGSDFLWPPRGGNLISIIENHKELRKTISGFFKPYNLEFLIDSTNNTIQIQKNKDGLVYKIPFELIAETLQRMIFYMAAIMSNTNSTLIFEEPETQAYPPYLKLLSDKIMESATNQFFIATHNPYILNSLLENDKNNEVNLFLVDYEDHQTTIQLIKEEEKREMLSHGIDIFFNERWFQQGA